MEYVLIIVLVIIGWLLYKEVAKLNEKVTWLYKEIKELQTKVGEIDGMMKKLQK